MAYVNVRSLPTEEYIVVDLDTGAVVGPNVALVRWPHTDAKLQQSILTDTQFSTIHALNHGKVLYVSRGIKKP